MVLDDMSGLLNKSAQSKSRIRGYPVKSSIWTSKMLPARVCVTATKVPLGAYQTWYAMQAGAKSKNKMVELEFQQKTKELIDSLKSICAHYGLGNDGNEFKIITQTFLYKFLNDKFAFEAKNIDKKVAKAEKWENALIAMSEDELEMLYRKMGGDTARLKPHHLVSHLFNRSNTPDFAKLFDDTLRDIAQTNNDVFAVKTDGGAKVVLFDRVSEYIADESKRDAFCRAIINKLVEFSFERIFTQKFDFYATIFEYLIKDYNSNSGGKYAEYYTPPCGGSHHGSHSGACRPTRQSEKRQLLRPVSRIRYIVNERGPRHW